MEFVCKVGTPSGEVVEQTFHAPDEAALRHELEQKGYYLFSLRRGLGLKGLGLRQPRIPNDLLILFGQELAALLRAGLPLLQSLDVMLERQKDVGFRASLNQVREKVKSGLALSEAFRAEGALYPPVLSASLVAGERSGDLESVLRRFVQYLRLNQSLRKKAISASVYPALLVSMMLVLMAVLMLKVIPQFQEFYADFNVELPAVTRGLMFTATALRNNLALIAGGLGVGLVAAVVWRRREGSAAALDRFLLRLPYVGSLMRMYATSQLGRTLSALLAGGLPLVQALEVAAASVGNRAMAAAVSQATPLVREGKSLTASLESTRMLESVALEMVKVGEQTGALSELLSAIADFYDEELDTQLARAMALIEPLLLLLMALVVAGMLLAFYLPLFQAISAIQH